jgi:multidrug efflux system outer membrane protein
MIASMSRGAVFRVLCGVAALAVAPHAAAEELSFSRALKLARQRAPELKAAKATLAGAEAQVDLSRSTYFPSLSATGTGSETGLSEYDPAPPPRTTPFLTVNYTTAAVASGALRWTVFDFGRTANAVDSAEAQRDSSQYGVSSAESDLVDAVGGAYLDVVYGEKVRDIERSIVDEREKLIVIVKALVKQALQPAVEELRAQSRAEAARRDLEQAEGDLAQARATLLLLVGLDVKAQVSVTAPRLPRPRMDVEAAGREAEEKKPVVLVAKANVAAGEASIAATRARYFPSLNLNGDATYRLSKFDTFDAWLPIRTLTGSVVLTVPLYDPSNYPRLDSAKADAAKAEATYELARRDARTEASKSVLLVTTSERVLDHAKKAAEASAAVLAVIKARYVQGLSSTLDLIDADTTDAEARLAAVKAERSLDGAAVRLLSATGRSGRLYDVP